MSGIFNLSGLTSSKKPLGTKVSNAEIGSIVTRPARNNTSNLSVRVKNSPTPSLNRTPTANVNNTLLPSHYLPKNNAYNHWSMLGRNKPTKGGRKSRKTRRVINKRKQKKSRKNIH